MALSLPWERAHRPLLGATLLPEAVHELLGSWVCAHTRGPRVGSTCPFSRPFSEVEEPSQGDLQMTQVGESAPFFGCLGQGGVLGQLRSPGCPGCGSIEGTHSKTLVPLCLPSWTSCARWKGQPLFLWRPCHPPHYSLVHVNKVAVFMAVCWGFTHLGQKWWAASGASVWGPLLDSGCRDRWEQGSLIQKTDKGNQKCKERAKTGAVSSGTVLR